MVRCCSCQGLRLFERRPPQPSYHSPRSGLASTRAAAMGAPHPGSTVDVQRAAPRRLAVSVGAQPTTAIGTTQRHPEPQPLLRTVVTFPAGPVIVVLVARGPHA